MYYSEAVAQDSGADRRRKCQLAQPEEHLKGIAAQAGRIV